MLKIKIHSSFKRDYKRVVRRGFDVKRLMTVIDILANEKELPEKYKDHALVGEYKGCRECNITSDWLLVYEISGSDLILYLTRTGTHSDLFKL